MGDEKSHRVNDALSTLVDVLVPRRQGEDNATADDRHEHALCLTKSIIEGYASCLDTLRKILFADLGIVAMVKLL